MSTSGITTLSYTRNEIIQDAFLIASVYGLNQSIRAADNSLASRLLNRILKSFENAAMHIWKRTEGTLFLVNNQPNYILGDITTNATKSYILTTVSVIANSGDTSITVNDSTGMVISNNIGIVLDNNNLQWTTITNIIGNVITLNNSLTSSVAIGNNSYVYDSTNIVNKPIDLMDMRYRNMQSLIDVPMTELAYQDYQALPNKVVPVGTQNSNTVPLQWTYNRMINDGTLYLWPVPANQQYTVNFTYYEPLQIFEAATDTADIPSEWYEYLIQRLALMILGTYGKRGSQEYAALQQEVATMEQSVLGFDNEETYVQFKPDWTKMN